VATGLDALLAASGSTVPSEATLAVLVSTLPAGAEAARETCRVKLMLAPAARPLGEVQVTS
jgi:hypothetical protein